MVRAKVSYDVMDPDCSQSVTSWDSLEEAMDDAFKRAEAGENLKVAKVSIVPLKDYKGQRNIQIDDIQPEPAMTVESFN